MKKTKSKRKKSTFIKGVRPKTEGVFTTVITVALIFFSTFLIYTKSIDSLEAEIKLGLKSNVSAAATTINGDLHKLFTKETKRDDSLYVAQSDPLENIRQASKDIRYIYTNILIDDSVYFVLNPSPQNDNDNDGYPDLAPALMDEYNDPAPALLKALKEQKSTVSDIYTDEWGVFISGYAPFYDKNGKFVGTLGMDLELNNFYNRLLPIKTAFEKTAIIILFIGLIIGLLIWYIRKHTQTLLLSREQNEIQKETTKSILENVYKENLLILKKVKNNILDLKAINVTFLKNFNSWITHIINYQESKVAAKKNASVSFKTDDFISEIKRHKIILNIEKDNNVPTIVYGFPISCYIELIDELISIVAHILETKELDVTLSQTYEGINDIKIALQLSGKNVLGFEEKFLELSQPEVNLFDRSLQHKEFRLTTVIAQLAKYQSTVSCFSNKTHCGCLITLSLLKPPE